MTLEIYFECIEKFDPIQHETAWRLGDEAEKIWKEVVRTRNDDETFELTYIKSIMAAFQHLPKEKRLSKYTLAWHAARTGDAASITQFSRLKWMFETIAVFGPEGTIAEVLDAYEPLFTEAERLVQQSINLTSDQLKSSQDQFFAKIFERHAQIRRDRPELIKYFPTEFT